MASIRDWSRTPAENDDADSDINWAEGQSAASVNDSARQMMARVAELLDDVGATQTTGGTANAHTLTARSSFTAYETGIIIGFKAGATNTGAVTLNVNGIGAKDIRKITSSGESALGAGDITANGLFLVIYDAAANSGAGAWILLNQATVISLSDANTFTESLTVSHDNGARIIVDGAAETVRGFTIQTAGSSRWRLSADTTAESGSSAGSDLQLHRWADSGFVSSPIFTVTRASGVVDFSATPTVSGDDIYYQGNIVGTVSQSSGDPTGAIIEQGSNANGEYTKYADGTLECRQTLDLGSRITAGSGTLASPYRSSIVDWTFPASFNAAPVFTATGIINAVSAATRANSVGAKPMSTSLADDIQAVMLSSDNTDVDVTGHVKAEGRWF